MAFAPKRDTGLSLLAALALFLGGSAGFAAEEPVPADPGLVEPGGIPGTPIEPVQAKPPAAETPPEPKLLGDLGGLRPALAAYGIDLELGYIGETFGVVHGGVKRGAIYEGQAGVGLGIDLEKMLGWPGAKAYANAFQIHGRGPSADLLGGNLMTASNIEALPTTRLYRLWFEQSVLDERASLRLGQLAADDEFITSHTAGGLINGTFGWPAARAADLPGGGPAYPLAQPGVRLQVKPAADLTVRAAAFSDNPGGRNCRGDPQECDPHGVKFAFSGGTLWLAEIEYTANAGKGVAGLPGVYKLGGLRATGTFPNQLTGALDRRGNWAIYAVADQAVWRRSGSEDQGVNFFLRVGSAPSGRNLVAWYADGGLGFKGPFTGRGDDVLTVGAAYGRISAAAALADRLAEPSAAARSFEAVLELSYIASVMAGVKVQPDVQYVINPGAGAANPAGGRPIPNALVLGLRTTLEF